MRIIGGEFKGRRFHPPADKWPTRPTTDFAKEALYNILENRLDFDQIRMLDLFGGTGSHSYEAISRGCRDVVYVDKFSPCLKFVKEIAQDLGIESYLRIYLMDVAQFLKKPGESFDYIFAGPPYQLPWLDEIPDLVFQGNFLRRGGVFVLEHNKNHHFESHPHFEHLRRYGGTHFSFFTVNQSFDD
jgi:16S rRNA (guanine966-N2)-methyltransferase